MTRQNLFSFSAKKNKATAPNKGRVRPWAVLFWLFVWEIVSLYLHSQILLVSPIQVLVRLTQLLVTHRFWESVAFSFCCIAGGFLLATVTGVLLAALSACFKRVEELLIPLMLAIKSIPVASFIILALIWFSSRNLSVLISFLMVLPVIYTNVLDGIRAASPSLLETARVFRLPIRQCIRYIYVPEVLPFFRSGSRIALGLCWKAGIAAEVIGMPRGSIGERLQQAKIYLDTPDLFAWTLVIICISLCFEKVFLWLLQRLEKYLCTMPDTSGRHRSRRKSIAAHDAASAAGSCSAHRQPRHESSQMHDISSTADSSSTLGSTAPAITLRNVSKSFDGKKVFSHLQLSFPAGETTAVMAPSGGGKTTLLRLLTGLESPDAGSIQGLEKARLAVVFQEDRLCNALTASANIRLMTPSLSRQEVQDTMTQVGLTGCDGQPVREFSGGMRRRTAILRALLSDYDILLLDEPFKGLDEATKTLVMEYTRRRSAGRTVILVTHDPQEAAFLGARILTLPEEKD